MAGGYTSSSPKNILQQALHETSRESKQPVDEQDRISYGIISKVNQETSQVKVRILKADGTPGDEITDGYLPLMNPLSEIYMLYGALREGLTVRIFWKGKLRPKTAVIEVIGGEDVNFLNKQPEPNEVFIGPYKIFSGGVGV